VRYLPLYFRGNDVCYGLAGSAYEMRENWVVLVPSLRMVHPSRVVVVCAPIGEDKVAVKRYRVAGGHYVIEIFDLQKRSLIEVLDRIDEKEIFDILKQYGFSDHLIKAVIEAIV